MNLPKFGVEIECFLGCLSEREGLERGKKCQEELTQKGFQWRLTKDCSVAYEGFEFVSPILSGMSGLEEVETVVRHLQKFGMKVNRSCGLHVHVDARTVPFQKLIDSALRYDLNHDAICKWLPARRANSEFACRLTNFEKQALTFASVEAGNFTANKTIEDFVRVLSRNGIWDRQRAFNLLALARHGTVEFRALEGSLSAPRVLAWIEFCLNFCRGTWEFSGDSSALPLEYGQDESTLRSLTS